jgi:hypothetical protein
VDFVHACPVDGEGGKQLNFDEVEYITQVDLEWKMTDCYMTNLNNALAICFRQNGQVKSCRFQIADDEEETGSFDRLTQQMVSHVCL